MVDAIPYCYYFLRVLYFANFCDLEKNRKIKYPQKFLPSHQDKLRDVFHFGTAFSFLPSHAITSSRKCRLMISMIVGVGCYWITGACCTMWHVSRKSTRRVDLHVSVYIAQQFISLDTATFTKPVDVRVDLSPLACAKSQNSARRREIANLMPAKSSESKNRKILYSQN